MIGSLQRRTRFDLHLHSSRSDGRLPPEEVISRCAARGLEVVSLTDHDVACAVRPGEHRIDGRRLLVIAGAELSGVHDGSEFHLLVYFPETIPDRFRAFCTAQCVARAERYTAALRNLALEGLPDADAEALAGGRALTRLHIARALVEAGHVRDLSDAFRRYLGEHLGRVPQLQTPMVDVLQFARSCGGVTSWAHPAMSAVERYLDVFVSAGLQGLEGLRPYLKAKHRSFYRRLARQHGLFLTGGSDWHGWKGDDLGLFHIEGHSVGDFVDTLQAA